MLDGCICKFRNYGITPAVASPYQGVKLGPGPRPQAWESELTLRIIMCKREQSADDDGSTLALKPMDRVNRSPKERVPVAPQKISKKVPELLDIKKHHKPLVPQLLSMAVLYQTALASLQLH